MYSCEDFGTALLSRNYSTGYYKNIVIALVHAVPNVQQTLLQFVNAVQLRLMHSLLDVTPYLVID